MAKRAKDPESKPTRQASYAEKATRLSRPGAKVSTIEGCAAATASGDAAASIDAANFSTGTVTARRILQRPPSARDDRRRTFGG